jgi:hypothetical protein
VSPTRLRDHRHYHDQLRHRHFQVLQSIASGTIAACTDRIAPPNVREALPMRWSDTRRKAAPRSAFDGQRAARSLMTLTGITADTDQFRHHMARAARP